MTLVKTLRTIGDSFHAFVVTFNRKYKGQLVTLNASNTVRVALGYNASPPSPSDFGFLIAGISTLNSP